jgi:hypothetical protein
VTKPLILAIAPDRGNVSQLKSIASRINAELRITDSVEAGLMALKERIPDLILTPPLLSARDDMALTGRLRELGDAAAHIQTLTIPTLQSVEPPLSGMFGTLRRDTPRPAGPEACETETFAEQVAVYLKGAIEARQRHSPPVTEPDASVAEPDAPVADVLRASPARHVDEPLSMEEFDLSAFMSEQVLDPLPMPAMNEPSTFGDLSAFLPQVDEAVAVPAARTRTDELTQFIPEEPGLLVDEASRGGSDERSELASKATVTAPSENRPEYDSWHFFDPDQPRFAALLARLDAIAATGT